VGLSRNTWEQEGEERPREEEDEIGKKYVATIEGNLYEVYPAIERVPNEWWLTLWEMYETGLNIEDAIQEQRVYTLQQFFEALIDPEYKKSLILINDRQPMGLMLGTTNLEKMRVNYVNPNFLLKRFPEITARNRLFYVTMIVFSPELRSMGFFDWFLSLILWTIEGFCDIFVSDVTDTRNVLMDIIENRAEKIGLPNKPAEVLGTQTYYALIREGL
jgi:hypothetical protein